MNSFLNRIGLTAWRKKSTIIVAVFIGVAIILCLQYVYTERKKSYLAGNGDPEALIEGKGALRAPKVQFIASSNKVESSFWRIPSMIMTESPVLGPLDYEAFSKLEQPSRDAIAARKKAETDNAIFKENESQLGIPAVNLDTKNPFVPKQRIVHFDLKGAPPKISFFKRLFPLLKTMGATGILMEYEDMFPFEGVLQTSKAKNAYTVEEVKEIISLADESKLEIIPLVQTFGHVEFVLKHREFEKLREVPGSPQALCPSKNASLEFIIDMVTQVVNLHPKSTYLHIGCDEVFQMGECQQCRLELHETLFLRHVKNVANLVHKKFPNLKLIIWDDMLRHLSQQTMVDMQLGNYVEPMVWVYAEDIYRFVGQQIWDKYAAVFKGIWTASAYKGAFGETLIVPDARRHLENNLRWLDVMQQQKKLLKVKFRGIALTGWQRYDHFAVLCELLPASLPSLAINLLTVTHGYFNSSLRASLLSVLSCPQHKSQRNSPFISLEIDPNLFDKLGRCMFPGSPFFRLMYRVHTSEIEVLDYLHMTKRHKGWMTEYNVKYNYTLPLRVDELTAELPRIYHGLVSLARSAYDAMIDIYDHFTISEWIEQKLYPYIIELERIQNKSYLLKSVNYWPSRPLPVLLDLQRLGVPIN